MCKCNQCGNCCKGIRINFELDEELKAHFIQITEEDAIKYHPIFALFRDNSYRYYNCNKLVDNKCSIHNNKPSLCKAYPSMDGHSIKDIECGYFDIDDELDLKLLIANKLLSEKKEV